MAPPELTLGEGDVIAAIVDYLAAGDLVDTIDDRIFGHELPEAQADDMPRPAIVVSEAGGYADNLPEVLDRARVDFRCYGRTLDEAKRLAVIVADRMRTLRRYAASNGVLLHAPQRSGGFLPLREPAGDWPLVLRSWVVIYDVRSVA